MRRRLARIGLAALLASAPAHAARACELELMLAVDVSGSVDHYEYRVQMQGLANALRSRDIVALLENLAPRGVHVSLVQWSGEPHQRQIVDWRNISGAESIRALAREIEQAPRAFVIYSTAIGEMLAFALRSFAASPRTCRRRIVDISGDGRNNEGVDVAAVRDLAVAQGVTINGLAILGEDEELDDYFRREVTGGNGSFVETATDYTDYPRAIRRKLLRELSPKIGEMAD